MKKLLVGLITILGIVCSIAFVGCGEHVHSWNEQWAKDASGHWKTCFGCEEIKDKAEHDGETCSICGYQSEHVHVYSEEAGFVVENGKVYNVKKCACNETSKTEMTDYYLVTPETVQDVLDGKEGSLDNHTIVFANGDYNDVLYFGRPTVYDRSNTIYKGVQGSGESANIITDLEEIKNMAWGSRYYTRTIKNVTIVAENGAVLPKIIASSGHVHGSGFDYVLNKEFSGSGYFLTHIFENITFKGVSFDAGIDFATSQEALIIEEEVIQPATSIKGLTFQNCSFALGSTEASVGAGIRVYSESALNNEIIQNVVVKDCSFNNVYQGIYTGHVKNITVENCSFDTTGHNAIAIQNHGTVFNHGVIVINENTFNKIADRIIRFNALDADKITITNNVATESGDEEGQVIKAESIENGIEIIVNNNQWGEGKLPANVEFIEEGILFESGLGTQSSPYIISSVSDLEKIAIVPDFAYFKVKDGVESLDLSNWVAIRLNGCLDGNGVKLVNLSTRLFTHVGNNQARDIYVKNIEVDINFVSNGHAALIKEIDNFGTTVFENVKVHGYIEGESNTASIFSFGTENGYNGGSNYTVELKNVKVDADIVCVTAQPVAAFVAHAYAGTNNKLTLKVDDATEFTGKLYSAGDKKYNEYVAIGSYEIYKNGQLITQTEIDTIAISKVVPVLGEDGYTISAEDNVNKITVSITAQISAYDNQGNLIPKNAGITMTFYTKDYTENLEGDVKILDKFSSAEIVNHASEYDMEIVDGVLKIFVAQNVNYASGVIRLQVQQYDAQNQIISCGTLNIYTIEK